MSGTSLDGLDIACCRFESDHVEKWGYEITVSYCKDYDKIWKGKLGKAHLLSGQDLMLLNAEYGSFIGNEINAFIKEHQLEPNLIASHGHTVFHQPENKLSFQIGAGSAIYAVTGVPVVSDFRSVDVNLGGQGAPLVPVGDALLFAEYAFCLNLGGIANISFDNNGKRIAFDICGCNLLLNIMANEKGLEYDDNGNLARNGQVNEELLGDLNSWGYHRLSPPKSLDKETMLSECLPLIRSYPISTEDKLATLVEYISGQVADSITNKTGSILVTGGGAMNKALMEKIIHKTSLEVVIPATDIIHFKEALIFAFLGMLRVVNQNNTLTSVTGARHDSIGGALYGRNPSF